MRRRIRYFARRYIFLHSHHDRVLRETVNVIKREDVIKAVGERFGVVPLGCIPDVEVGEVLSDSRGRGSFQKRPEKVGS